ncbi:MAG: multidrug ABC transporter ATP-binding protein [Pedosphaera sp. Tous-C6FEB]|nr:MAG: multidrug ABC transporter ATP-binding protein [Pedosphaera sp. Tous-C6FEB]
MRHLKSVFEFGWPYMRRYQSRLWLGVLCGILLGLSNASFIWATKTIFVRLENKPVAPAKAGKDVPPGLSLAAPLAPLMDRVRDHVEAVIDPWLPLAGRPLDARQMLGGFFLLPVLVGLRGMLGYFSTYCMCWVSERVMADLRADVLVKLNQLSLDFFNRTTMGDLITRINGDTAALYRCMALGFGDLIREPITILSVVVGLCLVDWQLTVVALVFVPLILVPLRQLGSKMRRVTQAGLNVTITQSSALIEALAGIRVIQAFGLEARQEERFREQARRLIHYGMKAVQARELVNPVTETIAMLGLGSLVLFIFWKQSSLPDMIGFVTGLVMLLQPLKKLTALHVLIQQTAVGVDRLFQLFAERPTVANRPDARPVSDLRQSLTFEGVHFGYGDKPVLKGLNLVIPRGMKLGIAGESGSGKSTLVNLIFRFHDPTGGSVKLDGVDLRDLALPDLRRQMALVSQEVVIFDQTIADNIACGKTGATRAEIEAAARQAYAHDFIMQLPEGYDTRVGERGVTLSGGQRQRLVIARAFVRNAPILVLDEATASLDSRAEAEVQKVIDQFAEHRTVICVAHRLSTLAAMDRIIVLAHGQLVEQGSFAELLQADGEFAAMARRQGIGQATGN